MAEKDKKEEKEGLEFDFDMGKVRLGGEGRLGFGRRVVLRLGELGLRLLTPLGCPWPL